MPGGERQGGAESRLGLVEPLQAHEHAAEIGVRVRVVRTLLDADAGRGQRFLVATGVRQGPHQIQVGVSRLGIVRDDVMKKVTPSR